MTEMRRVTAIRNGTVVAHIPAGHALQVIQMLRIDMTRTTPVSLVMNVPSDKLGRKDVLKVEDRELSQEELDRLALIAPTASIAIIRNHAVAEKLKVSVGTAKSRIRYGFKRLRTILANRPDLTS